MNYIRGDGSIGPKPWFRQLTEMFWGFVTFFITFFKTLTNPSYNGRGNQYVADYRGPGGGGGPPQPPKKRIGGFATLSSCRAPMPGGG